MTNEEAKDLLDNLIGMVEDNQNNDYDEALKLGIEALEKQIPKTAIRSKEPRYGMGEEYYDWVCPTCGEWLAYSPDSRRYEIHHCRCGQKLDWSEVKESKSK